MCAHVSHIFLSTTWASAHAQRGWTQAGREGVKVGEKRGEKERKRERERESVTDERGWASGLPHAMRAW